MTDSNARPLRVFLCHASVDRPAVHNLYFYLLRQPGIEPWLDQESLLPGENWQVEIPKALSESDVIIICLSKTSIDKESYVQKEITIALDKALEKPEGKIFIIPAKLEECDLPTNIKMYQSVDLFREDDYKRLRQNYKRLMKSLRKRTAELGLIVEQVPEDTKLMLNTSKDSPPSWRRKEFEQSKPQKKFKNAKEAFSVLPSTTLDLLANADNAYYAAEYEKAIQFYKQILDSDPDNKHAQEQIRKAERSWTSKNVKQGDLPIEALQLYKRSRSFIAIGDLVGARKLLRQAIDIAEEAHVDFNNAKSLLGNIQNALKAEEFKKKAFEALDTQLWMKALANLNSAIDLDPTDDVVQTLMLHLRSLLKAQNLINSLKSRDRQIKNHKAAIKEIREIIELTDEIAVLSKLWQDVVRLFGEYNNKKKQSDELHRSVVWGNIMWGIVFSLVLIILALSSIYLLPHARPVVDCSTKNGLEVTLDYPNYIANGDTEEIKLTIKNVGDTEVSGSALFDFNGAKVHLDDTAKIKFENLAPFAQLPTSEIHFSLNEQNMPKPGQFIDFNAVIVGNNAQCASKDYFIVMSPIYSLRKVVGFLWSIVAVTLVSLFKDRIKELFEKIFSRFKGKSG